MKVMLHNKSTHHLTHTQAQTGFSFCNNTNEKIKHFKQILHSDKLGNFLSFFVSLFYKTQNIHVHNLKTKLFL